VEVLQVNVGKVCNQACKHCHVDAGPSRTESMSEATAARVLALVARHRFPVLDITGGAPELNPSFRALVEGGVASGSRVFVRHNLTVTFEPGQNDLPDFFAARGVELFSSLPHYTAEGTDRQRGGGVFAESIASLQRELAERHGVRFDRLVSIANMPIRRYREWLERTGQHARYQRTLEDAFNPATVSSLMCRTMVSVSWDGRLYDCDFNQMVDLAVLDADPTLAAFDLDALAERRIATAAHCFGCTAGSGSSCGGALT
jgi:MoaA/NifB/PqqE/SkfB family radical SAM enzyme